MGQSQPTSQNGAKRVWDHFGACFDVTFGTSGPSVRPSLVPRPSFYLEGHCTSSRHRCVRCPGNLFMVWNDFGTRADVNVIRYPILLPWTLPWWWNGRPKVMFAFVAKKILVVFCDRFGTRAECWHDFGSYPVPISLTLSLAFKMILKVIFKIIFVFSATNLI